VDPDPTVRHFLPSLNIFSEAMHSHPSLGGVVKPQVSPVFDNPDVMYLVRRLVTKCLATLEHMLAQTERVAGRANMHALWHQSLPEVKHFGVVVRENAAVELLRSIPDVEDSLHTAYKLYCKHAYGRDDAGNRNVVSFTCPPLSDFYHTFWSFLTEDPTVVRLAFRTDVGSLYDSVQRALLDAVRMVLKDKVVVQPLLTQTKHRVPPPRSIASEAAVTFADVRDAPPPPPSAMKPAPVPPREGSAVAPATTNPSCKPDTNDMPAPERATPVPLDAPSVVHAVAWTTVLAEKSLAPGKEVCTSVAKVEPFRGGVVRASDSASLVSYRRGTVCGSLGKHVVSHGPIGTPGTKSEVSAPVPKLPVRRTLTLHKPGTLLPIPELPPAHEPIGRDTSPPSHPVV